jgi:hypothetical protein
MFTGFVLESAPNVPTVDLDDDVPGLIRQHFGNEASADGVLEIKVTEIGNEEFTVVAPFTGMKVKDERGDVAKENPESWWSLCAPDDHYRRLCWYTWQVLLKRRSFNTFY